MNKQDLIDKVDELIRRYQADNPGTSNRRALLDLLKVRSSDDDRELSEIVQFFSRAKAERETFEVRRRKNN
jgi:hypothetical protein